MEETDREIYAIFAPKSGRSLKLEYPELGEYQELKVLKPKEILFVWFYACKSSPYYDLDIPEKSIVEKCLKASGLDINDPIKKDKFLRRNFPEKINAGINVMNSFEPAARIIAKLDAMRDLVDIRRMTSLQLDDDGNNDQFKKDDEIDFTKKKAYLDMVLKVGEKRSFLIQTIEQGYGVTKNRNSSIDKNIDDNGLTFSESWHEQ